MTDQEIVQAIAEKVIGWQKVRCGASPHWASSVTAERVDAVIACSEFDPLNDDADACMVLDRMAIEFNVTLHFVRDSLSEPHGWVASFNRFYVPSREDLREREKATVWGDDRRLCICLAALKAAGVEVKTARGARIVRGQEVTE